MFRLKNKNTCPECAKTAVCKVELPLATIRTIDRDVWQVYKNRFCSEPCRTNFMKRYPFDIQIYSMVIRWDFRHDVLKDIVPEGHKSYVGLKQPKPQLQSMGRVVNFYRENSKKPAKSSVSEDLDYKSSMPSMKVPRYSYIKHLDS